MAAQATEAAACRRAHMAEIQAPQMFSSFLAGRQARQGEQQQEIENQFAQRRQQMQEQEFQAQQDEMARRQQFNQLAGEFLGPETMEATGGFQSVGGPQQPPPQQQRPSFSQLVALDPQRALQLQQAQQAQIEQRQQQDQQHAKEVVMRAQYALQSKAPATLLRIGFPEFVNQLKDSGVDVDSADDDTVRGWAQTLIEHYGPIAGVGPAAQGGDQFTLGAGQTRFDAQGRPIASVADDPSTKDPTDKGFTRANTLRDEFTASTKDFGTIQAQYNNIKATSAAPSAAGDIALITSYMRMLDPMSTVRDGEFANAENAGGVPERVKAQWNKLQNGERLSDQQRKDFVAQSGNVFKSRESQYKQSRTKYTKLAQRAEVNPLDVVGEEIIEEAPGSGAGASAAPSGAGPAVGANSRKVVGGKTYVQVGNDWFEDDGT